MIDLLPFLQLGPVTMSVSEATAHVKSLLEDDTTLADLWVRGEIADARTYASGHTYFTLRDGSSQLKCVLFRQRSRGLEPLENGRQYVVRGGISVYESAGAYQLYVTDHRRVGIGELYQQFEALKRRLEAEGLFAPERKRALPRWPRRIGIATSAQGAVLHDLRNVIGRRYPLAELVLAPCQVQGADAVRTVVASLRALGGAGVDVIVIARGGGSLEDLWAFNEEAVVWAIAAARVPVVSAIGHETDFTLADFAADVRAPTPSAAGELVAPDAAAVMRLVEALVERGERAVKAQLWVASNDLEALERRLRRALAARLERAQARLAAADARLQALSPLAVLARGYAVVCDPTTRMVIRSTRQVTGGQAIDVLLADGRLSARVDGIGDGSAERRAGGSEQSARSGQSARARKETGHV
ncbi:MAG: exodeoxyribonuclease VII large subunit [Chloroflexi bacterium]|nr:exodeoxyribonuclease VII large subunit [Chloroflexota bacterium]